MTDATLLIQPRDPLIVRDGRPFGGDPGARAVSLPWPYPSTVAGALRTLIGDSLGYDWRAPGVADRVKSIRHIGPFLAARYGGRWATYVPAPADALPVRRDGTADRIDVHPLRPMEELAGCTDLPGSLLPVGADRDEERPVGDAPWWEWTTLFRWLRSDFAGAAFDLHAEHVAGVAAPYRTGPPPESRVHVSLQNDIRSAKDGALFVTESRVFGPRVPTSRDTADMTAILSRIEHAPANWAPQAIFSTIGGERRLAATVPAPGDGAAWTPDSGVLDALTGRSRLRLVLVTPGICKDGFLPELPAILGPGARIAGAAVPRALPISGWDFAAHRPKPARMMAPAGSVYFVTLKGALARETVEALWLSSVCTGQDAADGFGIVLPGVWN